MSTEPEQIDAKLALQNALLRVALEGVRQLIANAPELYAAFALLVSKKGITDAEIDAKIEEIEGDTFEKLVPHNTIPPDETDTTSEAHS